LSYVNIKVNIFYVLCINIQTFLFFAALYEHVGCFFIHSNAYRLIIRRHFFIFVSLFEQRFIRLSAALYPVIRRLQ